MPDADEGLSLETVLIVVALILGLIIMTVLTVKFIKGGLP